MVFIELKSTYLAEFRATPGITNVIDYIFEQKNNVISNEDSKSTEFAVNSLIKSILSKDINSFSQIEEVYRRKQPDINSPWINNNYLILLFLIGLKAFDKDKNWLTTAVNIRKRNDKEASAIIDFFNYILADSLSHSGKLSPLFLSYTYLAKPELVTTDLLNSAIQELNTVQNFPCFESEFLNILYLSAFDASLALKDMTDVNLQRKINSFKTHSLEKISIVSVFIVYLLFTILIVGVFLFTKYVFLNLNETARNTIVTIIGLLGLTVLEIFKGRKAIIKKIENLIRKYLGYNLLD